MERPLALIVALAIERCALQGSLAGSRERRLGRLRLVAGTLADQAVVLIQAGTGPARARSALLAAAREYPLRAVWSVGFAGGLTDDLCPGDLVCPDMVLLDDGRQGEAFAAPPTRAAICAAIHCTSAGPLLTVETALRTEQAKRTARERTGAVAVDMEAAGVAAGAQGLGIPWLAIKAVVDDVWAPLPEFIAGCTTPLGDLCWPRLLWNLLSAGRRRALRRLHRAERQAALGLRRGLGAAMRAGSP